MANSDKNIRIETNKGKSGYPNIAFIGSTNDPIYLYVLDDNTISFEGSTGQLFSVSNSVTTGTIFSVNDISGIPSLRIDADGTVGIAEFSGNVGVGTVNPLYKLDVNGDINAGSGKTLRIGGVRVLDSTTLGSTVVNSSLTGVGTISSGTWNGSAVGVLYGGTGATTAADARTNLSAATAGTNSDITVLNGLQRLLVTIPTATGIGITVRGATSQTGNLQQWQNSSASNLSWINSAGTFSFGASFTHADGRTPGISVQKDNAAGIVARGYNSDSYPAIEVQNNPGSLAVGLYPSGLVYGGVLQAYSSTASTNTTTGSLIVAGGAGIAGSINAGGVSRFTSATASTSSATGGVVFSGGIGVGLTSYFASSVFIQGATASGSTSTGALVVTGGVGIGGSLQVTGTIDVADHIEIASQKELRFFNSGNTFYTAFKPGSSSANVTFTLPTADGTSNQALITNGSAALGWTSFVTAAITSLNGLTAATQTFATGTSGSDFNISSTTSTHTFNIPYAGAASTGLITTNAQTIAGAKTFSGNTIVSSSTASTSTSTGALIVSGGVGIGGSLWTSTSNLASISGVTLNNGTVTGALSGNATTSTSAGSAGTSVTAGFAGAATTATTAGSAGTSVTAGSATTATNAGSAGTSVTAGSATTATNAGFAGAATTATSAGTAGTATNAGSAGSATTATSAGTAGTATNAGSAGTSVTAGSAGTATNAGSAGSATTATSAGTAGTATNAGSAGTAVNAGSAGTATNSGRSEAIRTQALTGTNYLTLSSSDTASATQSMFVGSGISVTATSLVVPDDTRIGNNTQSTNTSSGALIVSGGVGITGNLNVGGNFVLTGDLTVNGTTTTVNSTVTTVVDPIITIGTSIGGTVPNSADSKDRGLAFYYFSGTGKTGFFGWDQSASKYAFYTDASISGEVVSGTKATIFADLDGNAGSATTATSSGTAGTATNAGFAGAATTATSAGTAGTATNAGSAGTSVTAGSAGTAVNAGNAGSATTATSAGTAGTATNAGSAGTSVTAGSAGTATNAANTNVVLDTTSTIYLTGSRSNSSIGNTAIYVLSGVSALGNTVTATTFSGNATTATSAGTAGTAANAGSAGTSVSAGTAGTATNAGSAGTSVTAGSAGTAVNAGNAGSATTATNATNVIFSADTTNTTRRLLYSYSGTGSSGVFNTGTLFVNPSTSAVGASIITATTSLSIRPGIDAASGVSIGNSAGTAYVYFDTTNNRVGINTATPQYDLHIIGEISATNKSFVIDHPTKEGMHLRYGSLEGPENGVYVRGKLVGCNTIRLPEYWTNLVDYDSITVTLTPIGRFSQLYVEKIENNTVYVQDNCLNPIKCYFTVYAERIDIPKLLVEY